MSDLIKALQIFLKYGDPEFPTHCEHDVLLVNIDHRKISEEDKKELYFLHFYYSKEYDCFISYRFGSY